MKRQRIYVFIGGLVIGGIIGTILGGLAVANVIALNFINANI